MRKIAILCFIVTFLMGSLAFAGGVIKVTYPNRNCKWWIRGVTYLIRWDKRGIEKAANVKISLVSSRFFNFTTTVPNKGFYPWTIPEHFPKGKYVIKITAFNGTYVGESVAFSIVDVPPHIYALSPSSGVSLLIKSKCNIRWSSSGIFGNVRISVWQGNTWKGNIYVGSNTENFNWIVGKLESSKIPLSPGVYRIRIQAIQDYSIYSDIDNVRIRSLGILIPGRKKPRLP